MAKGFSKQSDQAEPEMIEIESMVASRTGEPFVRLKWGRNTSQFTPDEAIAHASAIIQTACAAIIDAQVVAYAKKRLGADLEHSAGMLRLFRLKRQAGKLPSMTINIDGESMRSETVQQMGLDFVGMALMTEMEAMLVSFLLEELEQSPETADLIVQEFREMRGATTLWNK
jgi:hypothetical protein